MANKMIKCKSCGADIATNAKSCPHCGAKNRKPIYKKWWFYVLLVIVFLIVIGSVGDGESDVQNDASASKTQSQATPEPISYTHHNVTELFDALTDNAMKAQDTYKDQYVELEGYLGTIDSDGKYIGLGAGEDNYDYIFQEVQCYIKTDEQKQMVMDLRKGDHLLIRGQITEVGEILGYSLNIDSIE